MKRVLFAIALASMMMTACVNKKSEGKTQTQDTVQPNAEEIFDTHSSMTALDWAGVYANESDTVAITYDGVYTHISPKGREKGEFAWDESGNYILLQKIDGDHSMFKVEENRLINGELKILNKIN